ncbi:MAG: sugar phosphate isomerase/epimerase [Salinivirgaceae bacterium]|nr:sugar phosphate isomerase/epimerase [Salinivirgaceae bacterium]
MNRPITLLTGQWADLPINEVCKISSEIGYAGLELACSGDHFEVAKADSAYCDQKLELLGKHKLQVFALSNHLVGQAVCDLIDERHKAILPDYVWGNGNKADVQKRAADEMIKTAYAAQKMGVNIITGFTGSSIWNYMYSFPPTPPEMIEKGFEDFAQKWLPILDEYQKLGIKFALEVHPTEIAFDTITAERALAAVNNHPAFGFNFDPSHLAYQGVDYIDFIDTFASRIFHTHMKDVSWSDKSMKAGIFGGYLDFGDHRRQWNFVSLGRGKVNFEDIIRAFNRIQYTGPLSIEWEDSGMDRLHGAKEAYHFIKNKDFKPSLIAFDAAFQKK